MPKYADLKKNDVANGIGVCVSFWVQGCPHRCEGCHNPETWDRNEGKDYTPEVLQEIVDSIDSNGIIRNLSISGGDPMAIYNREMVYEVVRTCKEKFSNIKVFLWTGYLIEDIANCSLVNEILEYVDVLVDGKFELEKKDLSLTFCGSTNQRVIDINKSRTTGSLEILDII